MSSDVSMRAHPCLDLFPLMADDELAALAADITAHGLLDPVVVDREGVLLDGRCRLEACRRAGVAPRFRTYAGDAPVAFILSANLARASYPQSVRAMAVAQARHDAIRPGPAKKHGARTYGNTILSGQSLDETTWRAVEALLEVVERITTEQADLEQQWMAFRAEVRALEQVFIAV